MANFLTGEHEFEANGVKYRLRLDANAFCEIEGALDLSLPQLMDNLKKKPGIRVFRALLYGALYEHHRLTLSECGLLLGEIGFERVTEEIMALLKVVMPEGNAGAAAPNRQQRRRAKAGTARAES